MRTVAFIVLVVALISGTVGQDVSEYSDENWDDYEDGEYEEGEYGEYEDGEYDDEEYEDEEYEDDDLFEDEDCGYDGYCTYNEEDYEDDEQNGVTEKVTVEPPRFSDTDSTEVTVDLGNTARLTCSVINLGHNSISWKKDDELISIGDQLFEKGRPRTSLELSPSIISTSSSTLTITLVTEEDMGPYLCQVNQPNDETIYKTFIIETRAPPLVSIPEKPEEGVIILSLGDPLSLTCQGEGDPVPSLRWSRRNSLLPQSPNGRAGRLEIDSVSENDAGSYECEATNGFGHPAKDSVLVQIKHKPILMLTETYRLNQESKEVEALILSCVVRAFPEAESSWSRSDGELDLDRSKVTEENGVLQLEIIKPSQSDLGVYTCEATNSEGTSSEVLTNKDTDLLPDLNKLEVAAVEHAVQRDKLDVNAVEHAVLRDVPSEDAENKDNKKEGSGVLSLKHNGSDSLKSVSWLLPILLLVSM